MTTPKPAWEERFNQQFHYLRQVFSDGLHGEESVNMEFSDLKAFIQETLASERDELRKKIEAMPMREPEKEMMRELLDSQDKPTN